jgi:NADH:ubiquinone reductase (H+-translocating)
MQPIVVVGGGFAGAALAKELERRVPASQEIIVISRENHLVFTPLLPEVAARAISALHCVVPGREMTKRTRWITATVLSTHLAANTIEYELDNGVRKTLQYSHLLLACGSSTDMNAVPGMAAHAMPLKSIGDAFLMGNRVIANLEEAVATDDPARRQMLMTAVVIGGGFSGVEIAGHLNDLIKEALPLYPQLAGTPHRVVLLQRGERVLPELNAVSLSEFTARKLTQSGVDVRLKTSVDEITARDVRLKGGERIPSDLIVCTVGTATNPLLCSMGLPLERGRVKTDGDMRVTGHANVWALGDCAAVPNAFDQKPSPTTAQFAIRQGPQLAKNVARVLRNEATQPFYFRPQGLLASIGNKNGVAEVFGLHFSGILAWFFWRGVYLSKMPTMRRKLQVAIDWAWEILFSPNVVEINLPFDNGVQMAHYAAGDFVYQRGDAGDRLFVIRQGEASVFVDEDDIPDTKLSAGDYFGVGALLLPASKGRHSSSVRADTPLDLYAIDRQDFQRLSESLGVLNRDLERLLMIRLAHHELLNRVRSEKSFGAASVMKFVRDIDRVAANTPLSQVVDLLRSGKPGLAVEDQTGKLLGYCALPEVYEAFARMLPDDAPVEEFCRRNPVQLPSSSTLITASLQFLQHGPDLILIVEDGRLHGAVTLLDLVRVCTSSPATR